MSLAESTYCSTQQWDPQDPRCAQIILYGNIVTVKYSQVFEIYFFEILDYDGGTLQSNV